jgi:hypothetical protein
MHEHSGIVIPVRGQIAMVDLSIGRIDGRVKPAQAGKMRPPIVGSARLRD